jgi:hypothetical protein
MLKLLGHYRKYIHQEGAWQEQQAAAAALPPMPGTKPPPSPTPSQHSARGDDNALKGHGCCFDQLGFVASHK